MRKNSFKLIGNLKKIILYYYILICNIRLTILPYTLYLLSVNETNLECPKDDFKQVKWRKTVGRHFDRQICPSGAGKCVCF